MCVPFYVGNYNGYGVDGKILVEKEQLHINVGSRGNDVDANVFWSTQIEPLQGGNQ
jgi:hypothetical protein